MAPLWAGIALLCGCAAGPAVVTPEVEVTAVHRPTAWNGALRPRAAEPVDPGLAWQVEVACRHLPAPSPALLTAAVPCLLRADFVTTEPTGELLLPSSRLLGHIGILEAADFEEGEVTAEPPVSRQVALVTPHATTEMAVRWRRLAAPARTSGILFLRLDRETPDRVRLALGASDDWQHVEVAVMSRRLAPPEAVRLLVPLATGGDALVIELALRAPADGADPDAHRARLAELRAEFAATLAGAREHSQALAELGSSQRLDVALAATADPTAARSALRILAQVAGAPLTEDFAVVGDQRGIEQVAAEVRAVTAVATAGASAEILAPAMEKATLRLLAGRLATDPDQPLVIEAVLVGRAGAAGRFADLLLDIADRFASLADLDRMLVEENRRFLRSPVPAHRVRAFDWLHRRELSPAGFDPLASDAERRHALAASWASSLLVPEARK